MGLSWQEPAHTGLGRAEALDSPFWCQPHSSAPDGSWGASEGWSVLVAFSKVALRVLRVCPGCGGRQSPSLSALWFPRLLWGAEKASQKWGHLALTDTERF